MVTTRCAPVPFHLSSLHPSRVLSLGQEPKGRSPSVTRCGALIADVKGYGIPSLENSAWTRTIRLRIWYWLQNSEL